LLLSSNSETSITERTAYVNTNLHTYRKRAKLEGGVETPPFPRSW
jgi:hypothetical protein